MIDTGITLWWRWPILMAAGMPSKDTAELHRMVSEKARAVTRGLLAAQTEAMRITVAALNGEATLDAPGAIAAAALRPAFRTVRANARRLGRKR